MKKIAHILSIVSVLAVVFTHSHAFSESSFEHSIEEQVDLCNFCFQFNAEETESFQVNNSLKPIEALLTEQVSLVQKKELFDIASRGPPLS